MVLGTDKQRIRDNLDCFDAPVKFSRHTLFDQHREKPTCKTSIGKKIKPPLPGEQRCMDSLQLDIPGHHPDDKNFAYHREYIRIHGKGLGITGKELKGFLGSPNLKHSGGIRGCAFSPDGKILISVSDDFTLRLWDAETGTLIKTLELPWIPNSISVSPTSPGLVITANLNGTLTLFEIREIGG